MPNGPPVGRNERVGPRGHKETRLSQAGPDRTVRRTHPEIIAATRHGHQELHTLVTGRQLLPVERLEYRRSTCAGSRIPQEGASAARSTRSSSTARDRISPRKDLPNGGESFHFAATNGVVVHYKDTRSSRSRDETSASISSVAEGIEDGGRMFDGGMWRRSYRPRALLPPLPQVAALREPAEDLQAPARHDLRGSSRIRTRQGRAGRGLPNHAGQPIPQRIRAPHHGAATPRAEPACAGTQARSETPSRRSHAPSLPQPAVHRTPSLCAGKPR